MGDNPIASEVEAALRERFNLDGTPWDQYTGYVGLVFSGNFGRPTDGRNISRMLELAWPITITLALAHWVFELLIGLASGIASALRPGSFIDRFGWTLTLISLAIPTFAVALLLQL